MDFDDSNANNSNEMWEWREEEFSDLQRDSGNDVSQYLWDGVTQNEDNLLYMLDEQTPIKDCTDFGYQVSDIGGYNKKGLEECIDSSQIKRRRMLQFTSDANDVDIADDQITSEFFKSKVMEDSVAEDGLSENLQWDSQWSLGFTDRSCSYGFEELDPSSYGWVPSKIDYSPDEMNVHVAYDDQVDVSEFYNISPAMETDVEQETPPPAPPKFLRASTESFIRTPRKLSTSVVYPFAVIKPCGVQGDVTLKDINRRIHAPSPSRSKHVKDDDNPSLSYPTSAFSGKPVVVKTKIHTEGGKGSITVMRTKG